MENDQSINILQKYQKPICEKHGFEHKVKVVS